MALLSSPGNRLKRVFGLLLVLLGILVLRLAQLQLVMGQRYARLSERNRIRRIDTPAPRGRIFDRHGVLIADSRPSFTVAVIPTELPDSTIPLLAQILSTPCDELRQLIAPVAKVPFPVSIRRDVAFATVAKIEENNFRLPGVIVRVEPVRSYPDGERYCHAVGHLGEVSEEELRADTSYHRLDFVGRTGIEARYERQLRGRDGLQYAEVDVSGREIGPLSEKRPIPPVPGMDLHLTLDSRLQALACSLAAPYERAAIVGLEVQSGAVLCLVSRPTYDPNVFVASISSRDWEELVTNPSRPFFNRAIAAGYPPGSTLKPVAALAALHSRTISPQTTLEPCTGSFKFGNRVFRCWASHGRLNLLDAIAHSCNSYFYQIGLRLGIDSLTDFYRRLGLGTLTDIDIPGEKPGIIPSREWLDTRYGARRWTAGVLLNLAIGQGEILTTPLQMAKVYALIAGGGRCGKPYIVEQIDSAGKAVYCHRVETVTAPIDAAQIAIVKQGLSRVVEYGTGRAARTQELTIAGKTGTAQNPPRPDHAWFVGYAPAEAPRVVFAVLIENAGHGGAVAAPIAGRLFAAWYPRSTP